MFTQELAIKQVAKNRKNGTLLNKKSASLSDEMFDTIQKKLCYSSVNICRGSKYCPSRKNKVRKEIKFLSEDK